jgi:hypothetical protein
VDDLRAESRGRGLQLGQRAGAERRPLLAAAIPCQCARERGRSAPRCGEAQRKTAVPFLDILQQVAEEHPAVLDHGDLVRDLLHLRQQM